MNKIFNFRRFSLLVRNDLLINWKHYVLGYIAVLAGMFLFMLLILSDSWTLSADRSTVVDFRFSDDSWFGFVVAMVAIYFIVVLVSAFGKLKDKTQRVTFLMLPVTSLEKFVHQALLFFLLGGLLFTTLWIDAQLVREYIIWRYEFSEIFIEMFIPYTFFMPLSGAGSTWEAISMVLLIISLTSFFMMANIWFRRFGWIKMVVVLVLALYLFSVCAVGLSYLFFPEMTQDFRVHLPMVTIPGTQLAFFQVYAYVMVDIAWIFLLAIGYAKFKETEL